MYIYINNISKIVNRNWNILQINTEFHGVFQATPMIAFKHSRNLQEIIGVFMSHSQTRKSL